MHWFVRKANFSKNSAGLRLDASDLPFIALLKTREIPQRLYKRQLYCIQLREALTSKGLTDAQIQLISGHESKTERKRDK